MSTRDVSRTFYVKRRPMTNLNGKTAIVTGAGRGIGKGCALELARRGADIAVNDRPGSSDLAATVNEIEALGRRAIDRRQRLRSRGL